MLRKLRRICNTPRKFALASAVLTVGEGGGRVTALIDPDIQPR